MQALDTFPKNDLIQKYRNVFGAHEGPDVLAHILFELGLFLDIPNMTDEQKALKNYGARLLRIIGGAEVNIASIKGLINHLNLQPLPKEKKEGEE